MKLRLLLAVLVLVALLSDALVREAAFALTAEGQIAFTSDRDGNWEIYVMNADGTGQTNLTNHPALDWDPDWRPVAR